MKLVVVVAAAAAALNYYRPHLFHGFTDIENHSF